MKRSLIFGLAVWLSAVMTMDAFAGSKRFKGRADIQTALTGIGVNATSTARLEKAWNNRIDLTYDASASMAAIVGQVKKAYKTAKMLPGNYRIVGYAHLNRRGSWSVTMSRGGYYSMVEIKPRANGSKIILVGYVTKVTPVKRGIRPPPRVNR